MKLLLLLFLLHAYVNGSGQELPETLEGQQEQAAESAEESLQPDEGTLLLLEDYRRHPLDLNRATAAELEIFPFLTGLRIRQFLEHRKWAGKLLSLYELQAIPGWDLPTIRKIIPFCTIGPSEPAAKMIRSRLWGEHTVLLRLGRVLEKAKGYNPHLGNPYLGDPQQVLLRYRYTFKNQLQWGITAEKDPGEPFFKNGSRGFDFYSAHLFIRNKGLVKALALGDYTVNLGQGLLHGQGMGLGKSAETMMIGKLTPVLQPFRSSGEANFNRGLAITLEKGRTAFIFFISSKKISGKVLGDSLVTGLNASGLFRTEAERQDKSRLAEKGYGARLQHEWKGLVVGLNRVAYRFDLPLEKATEPYQLYALAGRSTSGTSLDFRYSLENLYFFGELATDRSFARAWVTGVLVSPDPRFDLSLLYRRLDRNFRSYKGATFSENTKPENEEGMYSGISFRPAHAWQVRAYADLFTFPWLRYRVQSPSRGWDYLVQVDYKPGKTSAFYIRYRLKNKPLNFSEAQVAYPENEIRRGLRLHSQIQFSPAFSIRNRAEVVWYRKGDREEQGFSGFTEAFYKPGGWFSANIRLHVFETDSYDSRIYAYESDLPSSFSIPAFYDKGYRLYTNLGFEPGRHFSFWLQWGTTIYRNKESIGSGGEEIEGNRKSRVNVQFLYRFSSKEIR